MMNAALRISGVDVQYKQFTLGPLDVNIDSGRVVGLVGPNGSGKTTTIRCIAGNLPYDHGAIDVWGKQATASDGSWKADIGYVADAPVFYDHMRAAGFLEFISRFYANWSDPFAAELAHRFELDLGKQIRTLSSGNRVKLALVAALAHKPRLALFDEPTAGLDPVVRTEVFDVLSGMMENEEMSIVYSTHIIDDLHRLADELIFLIDGRVRLQEAKDDLLDRWRRIRFQHNDPLDQLENVLRHERDGRLHELISPDAEGALSQLAEHGAESISLQGMTLDEIAVCIMKGK